MKKIALSAALLLSASALAGINAWTPVGPDGGSIYGGIRYVTANTAVAATTGGIYQTPTPTPAPTNPPSGGGGGGGRIDYLLLALLGFVLASRTSRTPSLRRRFPTCATALKKR